MRRFHRERSWLLLCGAVVSWPAGALAGGRDCLTLEGFNLGCVSSFDHSCHINRMVNKKDAPCYYVANPSVFLRVEAPIAWRCKSSRETTVCSTSTGGESSGKRCTTHSECLEYYDPVCDETCIPCYQTVVQSNTGLSKGCLICTREYCSDEPYVSTACAPTYGELVLGNGTRCSSDSRCPATAIDPLGKQHPVKVRTQTCKPPPVPTPQPQATPQPCPWKVDMRSATGCEPITPENRNTD